MCHEWLMGSLWEGELEFSREWCHWAHVTTQNSILCTLRTKNQMPQFLFASLILRQSHYRAQSPNNLRFMSSRTMGVPHTWAQMHFWRDLFYVCGCFPACLYTLCTHVPPEARKGHWIFWNQIYSCECHVADGNQKQVLLTAVPFLHSQPRCFLWILFIFLSWFSRELANLLWVMGNLASD